jgi:hypothetical protein
VSGFFIAIRPTPTTIITFRTLSFGFSGFGLEELFLIFSINPTVDVGRSVRLSSVIRIHRDPGTLPGAKVHCVRTWPKHMLV